MIPIFSADEITAKIRERMSQSPEVKRMVGLLFACPASPVSAEQIIPHLDYFYFRSGDFIDIYCAGYGGHVYYRPGLREVSDGEHCKWYWSSQAFQSVRGVVERSSTWAYSGGTDLILTDARLNPSQTGLRSVLDFSSTIICQLDRLVKMEAIQSVEVFFEQICSFADKSDGAEPTFAFSDKMGAAGGGSSLRRLLLSFLPKDIGPVIERVAAFAIRDASRQRLTNE